MPDLCMDTDTNNIRMPADIHRKYPDMDMKICVHAQIWYMLQGNKAKDSL